MGYKESMKKQIEHPLREWRKANDVTLAALAKQVDVTQSHLSEIERGVNDPSLSLAKRLSEATGLQVGIGAFAGAAE